MTMLEKLALFGQGPWLREPDEAIWRDADIVCSVKRNNHLGQLNGYVRVLSSLVKRLGDAPPVHGGVTWQQDAPRSRDRRKRRILGFDCGHASDVSPGLTGMSAAWSLPSPFDIEVYRTFGYTMTEVRRMSKFYEGTGACPRVWIVDDVPCLKIGTARPRAKNETLAQMIRDHVVEGTVPEYAVLDYAQDVMDELGLTDKQIAQFVKGRT